MNEIGSEIFSTPLRSATLRQKRRMQTRLDIHRAAISLFERQGVGATSVEEIAKASGVSTRTFFRYFANKEDTIFVDALDMAEAVEQLSLVRGARSDLLDQLLSMYQIRIDNAGSAARDYFRVQTLVRNEAVLQRPAYSTAGQIKTQLVAKVHQAMDVPDMLAAHLIVEIADAVLQAALANWRDGTAENLKQVFGLAREALLGLSRGKTVDTIEHS